MLAEYFSADPKQKSSSAPGAKDILMLCHVRPTGSHGVSGLHGGRAGSRHKKASAFSAGRGGPRTPRAWSLLTYSQRLSYIFAEPILHIRGADLTYSKRISYIISLDVEILRIPKKY